MTVVLSAKSLDEKHHMLFLWSSDSFLIHGAQFVNLYRLYFLGMFCLKVTLLWRAQWLCLQLNVHRYCENQHRFHWTYQRETFILQSLSWFLAILTVWFILLKNVGFTTYEKNWSSFIMLKRKMVYRTVQEWPVIF